MPQDFHLLSTIIQQCKSIIFMTQMCSFRVSLSRIANQNSIVVMGHLHPSSHVTPDPLWRKIINRSLMLPAVHNDGFHEKVSSIIPFTYLKFILTIEHLHPSLHVTLDPLGKNHEFKSDATSSSQWWYSRKNIPS